VAKIVIKTYKELEEFLQGFAEGRFNLVVLQGGKGTGKTFTVKQSMKNVKHVWLSTHTTPLANYKELYNSRDLPVIYSDLDSLWASSSISTALFKQLCETNPTKTLHYFTTSKLLEDTPNSFKTTSKVLVECNSLPGKKNENIAAVLSRGQYLVFQPTRGEMLDRMEEILAKMPISKEQRLAIFGFMHGAMPFANDFNLRAVHSAVELLKKFPEKQAFAYLEQAIGISQKRSKAIALLTERNLPKAELGEPDKEGYQKVIVPAGAVFYKNQVADVVRQTGVSQAACYKIRHAFEGA